ncbi:MAG TPA: hypothetical protein VNU01_08485, partial [Egibacteraceae bacterium]|nr:hypothetical protein [Egibacteraceae bacterium]
MAVSVRARLEAQADGAVQVRAEHLHPVQGRQHVRVRVPVGVARAGRHHGGVRADGRQEPLGVGGAAMVGHFQHLGAQPPRRAQRPLLRQHLAVAREQDAPARPVHPQQEAVLVRRRAGQAGARRAEHLHERPAQPERLAAVHAHDRDAEAAGGIQRPCGRAAARHGRMRSDDQRGGPQPPQHLRHAAAVVEVAVAEHRDIEPLHPQAPQHRGGATGIRPGVHQHPHGAPGTRRLDDDRVALPDVQRRERQGGHLRRQRPGQQPRHLGGQRHVDAQLGPAGERGRHAAQRVQRRPGQRRQGRSPARVDLADRAGGQAGQLRRARQRHGQHVRGQREQRRLTQAPQQRRCHGQLRGHRGRDGGAHPARAAQPAGHRGAGGQDPA